MREQQRAEPSESEESLEAFFQKCDAANGPGVEPDWDEHLAVIAESRSGGRARYEPSHLPQERKND